MIKDADGNVVTEDGIEGLRQILSAEEYTYTTRTFTFDDDVVARFATRDGKIWGLSSNGTITEIDLEGLTVEEWFEEFKKTYDLPYIENIVTGSDWESNSYESGVYKIWKGENETWYVTQANNGTDETILENLESYEAAQSAISSHYADSLNLKTKVNIHLTEE